LDSTLVEIQPDIKCLVGKNESGKTAFVEALRRLKPAQGNVEFSSPKHYPSWLEKRHRREAKAKGEDLDESSPITAIFGIEKSDKEAVLPYSATVYFSWRSLRSAGNTPTSMVARSN